MSKVRKLCSVLLLAVMLLTGVAGAWAQTLSGTARGDAPVYQSMDELAAPLEILMERAELKDLEKVDDKWYVFAYEKNNIEKAYILATDVVLSQNNTTASAPVITENANPQPQTNHEESNIQSTQIDTAAQSLIQSVDENSLANLLSGNVPDNTEPQTNTENTNTNTDNTDTSNTDNQNITENTNPDNNTQNQTNNTENQTNTDTNTNTDANQNQNQDQNTGDQGNQSTGQTEPGNTGDNAPKTEKAKVVIPDTMQKLDIYGMAMENALLMGSVDNGTVVEVVSRDKEWTKIQVNVQNQAVIGYVKTYYLTFEQNDGTYAYDPNYLPPTSGSDGVIKENADNKAADNTTANQPAAPDAGTVDITAAVMSAEVMPMVALQRAVTTLPSGTNLIAVYSTMSVSSSVVTSIANDVIVGVVEDRGEWTRISGIAPSTYNGYVETKYLRFEQSDGTWKNKPGYTTDPRIAKVALGPNMTTLRLYNFMNVNGTWIGDYVNDTQMTVLSDHGEWTYVEIANASTGNKVRGYMQTKYLAFQQSDGSWVGGGGSSTMYAYVNMTGDQLLNLRDKPTTDNRLSTILGQYYKGTRLIVYNWGTEWAQVKVEGDGKEGYMQVQFLSLTWPPSPGPGPTPTPNPGPYQYAVVNNANPRDWLNLRAYPSTTSSVLGQYYNGTQVLVLEYNATWCYVQVGGKIGYMMTKFLSFNGGGGGGGGGGTTPGTSAWVSNQDPRDRLNLRARPTTSSTSLGRYYNGTYVKVLEYGSTWCYVEVEGKIGYMMTYYLSFSNTGGGTGGGGTIKPPVGNITYAVVNNPVSTQRLNLRAQASTSSASLGQYYNGTSVQVLEYGNTWCYVQVGNKIGYMMTKYLSFTGGGNVVRPTVGYVNNPVTTWPVSLHVFATESSLSLGQFYNGTAVEILDYGTTWCRVTVAGLTGYMLTKYISYR